MRVMYNFERERGVRDFVDLSSFTGMEVEHAHNTAGMAPMDNRANLGHFDPNSTQQNKFRET